MIEFTKVHKLVLETCLVGKRWGHYTNDVYIPHIPKIFPKEEINSAILELLELGILELVPSTSERELRTIRFTNLIYPGLLRLYSKTKEEETT